MKQFGYLFFGCMLLMGCGVPVASVYDSARILDEESGEVGVSSTMYFFNKTDPGSHMPSDTAGAFLNPGAWLAFHAANRLDMRLSWEWGPFSDLPDFHFIQLAAKYGIVYNRLAFSMPIGAYLFSIDPEEEITRAHWEFSPRLLGAFPITQRLDLFLAGKMTFITRTPDVYPGFNLGLSLWQPGGTVDLDYRLEIGFMPVFPIWEWNENTQKLSTSTSQAPLWNIGFAVVLQ
jgi:hypothetical protein